MIGFRIACFVSLWLVPLTVRAQAVTLQARDLNESSGVAQVGDYFWSHNDSGDQPRLFVFAKSGELRCEITVLGAEAADWEDMCAFMRDGRQYVAIGDVGDNAATRPQVRIYVIEVPDHLLAANSPLKRELALPLAAVFHVTYPAGAVNCEALAYDPQTESFVLATKEVLRCRLFRVPAAQLAREQRVVAQWIGTLVLPLVTGADINPAGSQFVLTTYGPGCLIGRRSDPGREHEWLTEGERAVIMFPLPTRKQGESICFSRDGQTLFLTSEFEPTPLLEVPVPHAVDGSKH